MFESSDTTDDYPSARRPARRAAIPHLVLSGGPPGSETWRALPLRGDAVIGRSPDCDLPLLTDGRASRNHARLQGRKLTDLDSRNGVFVNGARGRAFDLEVGDVVRVGDTVFVVAADAPDDHGVSDIFGRSVAARDAAAYIRAVAREAGSLLIEGPPGTGKEYVAKAFGKASGRAGSFVVLNCANLSPQLAESALFGHRRGAFTGATADFKGAFERADGGVLFLDEVGELEPTVQAKLLRALEVGEIAVVGAKPKHVDVRVVAATNRALDDDIDAGRFRVDLLSRLRRFHLRLAPLAERREDILAFLAYELRGAWPISVELAERIAMTRFPANLRDVASLAARIRAFSDGGRVELGEGDVGRLGLDVVESAPASPRARDYRDRELLAEAARRFHTLTALAKHFGCERKTVKTWAEKLGVPLELDGD
ncbi:MAG: sigma 54-interacting transcriptional regulator [Myxococcales bacterium]|nr:sigma 54-interacting transcriptional regulator [Myxococcales bacterium]MCB9735390.1 sigma 54-interacting transcriptional regulator [Deltaproteobacteria bacterium]